MNISWNRTYLKGIGKLGRKEHAQNKNNQRVVLFTNYSIIYYKCILSHYSYYLNEDMT